jgi:WD40 repeat protein
MGVVYKARQNTLKRIVALKMILSGQLAGPEEVRRFYVEAEAAARLDHPNIVPIFEIGQHDGQHYFSMAFVDGESLARRVAAGPLPPRAAVQLVKKIADAVAYAHVEGVVHRDLKPANVLVDRDGEPRVTDFGLAKHISTERGKAAAANLTATGQVLGTPSYMPPEQAGGESKEIGPLSDVYSLGAILYCLLTGRPPFQAASTMETLIQVLQQEAVSPRLLNSKVPRDLETICLKCLEKEPQKRYASAAAFAEDLRRFLDGEPIVARPIGLWERGLKWAKRRPAIATLSTALILVALVGMGGITREWRTAEAERSSAAEKAAAEVLAREQAQDALAISLYQQARAVRLANMPGRRWRALELLKQAEQLRSQKHARISNIRAGNEESIVADAVPSRSQLRGEAVAALLRDDTRIVGHWSGICHSVSPDGALAATFWLRAKGNKFGLTITDLKKCIEVSKIEGNDALPFMGTAIALGPGGKCLAVLSPQAPASGGKAPIIVWELPQRRRRCELSIPAGAPGEDSVVSARFSPDGRYICGVASRADGNQVVVWDLKGAAGHVAGATIVKDMLSTPFSSDSRRLAFVSNTKKIRIWNVVENRLDKEIEPPLEPSGSMFFAADNTLGIAVKQSHAEAKGQGRPPQTLLIWDLEKNREIKRLGTIPVEASRISFCPDSRRVAINRGGEGTVLILDLAGNKPPISLNHVTTPNLLEWTDSRHLVSAGLGSMRMWEFSDEPPVSDTKIEIGSDQALDDPFAFSPDGCFMAVGAAGKPHVHLYDCNTRRVVRRLDCPDKQASRLTFSPDSKLLVRLSLGAIAWDVATGKPKWRTNATLASVGFRADGSVLVGELGSMQPAVFEIETGKELWRAQQKYGMTLLISPDGRFVTAFSFQSSNDAQTFPLVDLSTGQERYRLPGPPRPGMETLCEFSPDSHRLLTLHMIYRAARGERGRFPSSAEALPVFGVELEGSWNAEVWDVESGTRQMQIAGPSDPVACGFSPDGRYLAVRTATGATRVWDIRSRDELFEWHPFDEGPQESHAWKYLAFTADGTGLVIPSPASPVFRTLNLTRLNEQLRAAALDW